MNEKEIVDLQWTIEENTAKYIDEWVMDKVERLIDEKLADIGDERESLIYEIKQELICEMYNLKRDLEDQIQTQPKVKSKSFWKWWK